MAEIVFHPTLRTRRLTDPAGLIEERRLRRRDPRRDRTLPEGQHFTQKNIRIDPCPAFHMLSGRSQAVLPRHEHRLVLDGIQQGATVRLVGGVSLPQMIARDK